MVDKIKKNYTKNLKRRKTQCRKVLQNKVNLISIKKWARAGMSKMGT